MAVVSVNEKIEERRSEQDWRGRKHTRAYIVVCDNKLATTKSVLTASANGNYIPTVGDQYTTVDEFSWLIRKHATSYDNQPHTFRVICEYSSHPGHRFERSSEIPIRRPADVRFHCLKSSKPMQYDQTSELVANSAGVPYDPPIFGDAIEFLITYTKNSRSFSSPGAFPQDFVGHVNSGEFLNVASEHVKLDDLSGTYERTGAFRYWAVTFLFHFNLSTYGFEPPIVDQGFQELVTVDGKVRRVEMSDETYGLDEDGNIVKTGIATVSSPQLLNGQGKRIPPQQPDGDPPEPHNLWFKRYPTADFTRITGVEADILAALNGTLL